MLLDHPAGRCRIAARECAIQRLAAILWGYGCARQSKIDEALTTRQHDITEEEWQAFMEDLQQTFDKFQVPKREQDELIAIVNSTKKDIVLK